MVVDGESRAGQLVEPVGVELAGPYQQLVAPLAVVDAVGAQDAAELVDVQPQVVGRRARRAAAPQRLDEDVRGDRTVGVADQDGEQDALFEATEGNDLGICTDLEWAQHGEHHHFPPVKRS